jgi:hypothetical protein
MISIEPPTAARTCSDDGHVVAPVGVVEADLQRPHGPASRSATARRARSPGSTSSPLEA